MQKFLFPLLALLVLLALWGLKNLPSEQDGMADTGATAARSDAQSRDALPAGSAAGEAAQDDAQQDTKRAAADSAGRPAPSPAGRPSPVQPPATAAEKAAANTLLDFSNNAARLLTSGWYGLPEVLQANVMLYMQEWQLIRMPDIKEKRQEARQGLKPPQGLFSSAEAAQLEHCITDMDSALDAMRKLYKKLEDYVADASIQDDGVKGKALAQELRAEHTAFVAARDKYLDILENHAAAAEEVVLRDHPLQRQIKAAGRIFSLMRKSAQLLAEEKPDMTALTAVQTELEAQLTLAGKPPFQAVPELERLYRGFLKQAAAFPAGLARGLAEGFYSPVRNELNNIAQRSRHAYNAFVKAANSAEAL